MAGKGSPGMSEEVRRAIRSFTEIDPEASELPIPSMDELRVMLNQVLDTLEPREKTVLQMRLGLEDGNRRTFKEVGAAIGRSPSTAKRVEAKALKKLRS